MNITIEYELLNKLYRIATLAPLPYAQVYDVFKAVEALKPDNIEDTVTD